MTAISTNNQVLPLSRDPMEMAFGTPLLYNRLKRSVGAADSANHTFLTAARLVNIVVKMFSSNQVLSPEQESPPFRHGWKSPWYRFSSTLFSQRIRGWQRHMRLITQPGAPSGINPSIHGPEPNHRSGMSTKCGWYCISRIIMHGIGHAFASSPYTL